MAVLAGSDGGEDEREGRRARGGVESVLVCWGDLRVLGGLDDEHENRQFRQVLEGEGDRFVGLSGRGRWREG